MMAFEYQRDSILPSFGRRKEKIVGKFSTSWRVFQWFEKRELALFEGIIATPRVRRFII